MLMLSFLYYSIKFSLQKPYSIDRIEASELDGSLTGSSRLSLTVPAFSRVGAGLSLRYCGIMETWFKVLVL
jgi:hypothetical protein